MQILNLSSLTVMDSCNFVNSTWHAFFTCTINLTVNLTCVIGLQIKTFLKNSTSVESVRIRNGHNGEHFALWTCYRVVIPAKSLNIKNTRLV